MGYAQAMYYIFEENHSDINEIQKYAYHKLSKDMYFEDYDYKLNAEELIEAESLFKKMESELEHFFERGDETITIEISQVVKVHSASKLAPRDVHKTRPFAGRYVYV